jgi:hypothetical protein
MFKSTRSAITSRLAGADPQSAPVSFSWRLIRRNDQPFLLPPEPLCRAADNLELGSGQRRLAKPTSKQPLLRPQNGLSNDHGPD